MATKADLEKYLQNPNVQKMLGLISYTEGTQKHGARTAFGGSRLNSLKDHPRYRKTFTKTDGTKDKTSAAGKYQFLEDTWDGLNRSYKFSDFGEHNQDLGAVALLLEKGAIQPLLKGDFDTAVRRSGSTWASLPTAPKSYKQPTKSWKKVNNFLGSDATNTVSSGDTQPDSTPDITVPMLEPVAVPKMPTPQFPDSSATINTPTTTGAIFPQALESATYTKPEQPIPIVKGNKGLMAPETKSEYDLFSRITEADLDATEEPAVVSVGEALVRARDKQNSRSLISNNPLTPVVGELFDMLEV